MRIGVNGRLLVSDKMEGIARYIYETTLQMALSHPEDTFIVFFDRKINPVFRFPENVKKVIVPWHARHSLLWYLWFEVLLPIYFKKYRIDVFYSGEGYLSVKSRVPTLMVLHDLAYVHYPQFLQKDSLLYFRKRTPVFLEMSRSVATVSEYVKRDIISHFNVKPEKIIVAYNAVNPRKWDFNPLVETPDIPYFLYVGAIHPRKNVKNLIEAFLSFKKVNPGDTKLILIGRMAWDTDEVEQLIRMHQDIQYLGPLPEAGKNTWIKNAFCLTYVSVFEGFGIPLLEAFAMGVPVITSNVTSMPEVAGDAALCVNPFSPDDISQAMAQMYQDKALRHRLIRDGYHRVTEFSWTKTASVLYAELKKMSY